MAQDIQSPLLRMEIKQVNGVQYLQLWCPHDVHVFQLCVNCSTNIQQSFSHKAWDQGEEPLWIASTQLIRLVDFYMTSGNSNIPSIVWSELEQKVNSQKVKFLPNILGYLSGSPGQFQGMTEG